MVAHARADHPDEACGVIAGPEGSDRPERFVAMLNAERSPTFYRFDSGEQLKVWRAMENAGDAAIVIYHSHTATEAYPTRTTCWCPPGIPTSTSCAATASSTASSPKNPSKSSSSTRKARAMSVEVSIPTILRTHTGGEKRVSATGTTLQAVISDLESNYS